MAGRGQERSSNRIATGEEPDLGPAYPESVNTRPDSVEVLQVEASPEAQNVPTYLSFEGG